MTCPKPKKSCIPLHNGRKFLATAPVLLQNTINVRILKRDTSNSFVWNYGFSEPGQRSRYGDWLRAGRPRGRGSNPGRVKNFPSPSRPGQLWSTPNLSNGYGGSLVGEWSWPLTSNKCRGEENVDLYIHSPIRLHGVVLNSLSTGTTLPYYGFSDIFVKTERSQTRVATLSTEELHLLRYNSV
jgi:hypothetical protein